MPQIIYDYSKCLGDGDCGDACPVEVLSILEEGERWCSPVEDAVANEEAFEAYRSRVETSSEPVSLRVHFNIPDCIGCMACVAACSHGAIAVEEDFPEGQESVEEL